MVHLYWVFGDVLLRNLQSASGAPLTQMITLAECVASSNSGKPHGVQGERCWHKMADTCRSVSTRPALPTCSAHQHVWATALVAPVAHGNALSSILSGVLQWAADMVPELWAVYATTCLSGCGVCLVLLPEMEDEGSTALWGVPWWMNCSAWWPSFGKRWGGQEASESLNRWWMNGAVLCLLRYAHANLAWPLLRQAQHLVYIWVKAATWGTPSSGSNLLHGATKEVPVCLLSFHYWIGMRLWEWQTRNVKSQKRHLCKSSFQSQINQGLVAHVPSRLVSWRNHGELYS